MAPTRSASLTLAALIACWSLPATAQPPAEAELEAREAEAKRACDSGKVEEGARLLAELLRRTDDGTYIFNLGRCYQQNGQADQALPQFRAYLRRPDVDPAAAARAKGYIAELEAAALAAKDRPPPVPTPITAPPPSPALAALATPEQPAADSSPPSPGRTLRIAGLVTGAIGLAGLATGAAYAWRTNDLEQEKRDALGRPDRPTDEWLAAQNHEGERAERLQWTFLGAGGAALVVGGALYYLGWRSGAEGPRASTEALPLVMPGAVGAVIVGAF